MLTGLTNTHSSLNQVPTETPYVLQLNIQAHPNSSRSAPPPRLNCNLQTDKGAFSSESIALPREGQTHHLCLKLNSLATNTLRLAFDQDNTLVFEYPLQTKDISKDGSRVLELSLSILSKGNITFCHLNRQDGTYILSTKFYLEKDRTKRRCGWF